MNRAQTICLCNERKIIDNYDKAYNSNEFFCHF